VIPTDSIEDVAENEPNLIAKLIGMEAVDHTILGEEDEVFPLSDGAFGNLRIDPLEVNGHVDEFLLLLKGGHAEVL
tara:strand:+ start:4759 stop:4986 length:228 start_codon:yes stop_codon:yes gene_type:complete